MMVKPVPTGPCSLKLNQMGNSWEFKYDSSRILHLTYVQVFNY